MTLLEATGLLIDCAKTYGPEQDRILARAVKRMERRLDVLRLRQAKALKRRRTIAWALLLMIQPKCPKAACGYEFDFGDFCRRAELKGQGMRTNIVRFTCPNCGQLVIAVGQACTAQVTA